MAWQFLGTMAKIFSMQASLTLSCPALSVVQLPWPSSLFCTPPCSLLLPHLCSCHCLCPETHSTCPVGCISYLALRGPLNLGSKFIFSDKNPLVAFKWDLLSWSTFLPRAYVGLFHVLIIHVFVWWFDYHLKSNT